MKPGTILKGPGDCTFEVVEVSEAALLAFLAVIGEFAPGA